MPKIVPNTDKEWRQVAEAHQLNGTREAHKHAILTEYLEGQLNALLKIVSATALEFTGETKLESFV